MRRKNPSNLPEEPQEYPGRFNLTACSLIHSWSQPRSRTLAIRLEGLNPTFWITRSLSLRIYEAHQVRVNMTHTSLVQPWHCILFLDQRNVFADSRTGESDNANETKYAPIQEKFVRNMLKCKKLNEGLWIYDMVDFLKIPILRDNNAIHANFIWGGGRYYVINPQPHEHLHTQARSPI